MESIDLVFVALSCFGFGLLICLVQLHYARKCIIAIVGQLDDVEEKIASCVADFIPIDRRIILLGETVEVLERERIERDNVELGKKVKGRTMHGNSKYGNQMDS